VKAVVTSQGSDLSAAVDRSFGRAKNFTLVDTDTGEFSVHDNSQNLNAQQGAGVQAGQNVLDLGAEVVITGNVGPKAFAVLQAGNVKVFLGATGTVKNAVEQLKAGMLEEAGEASVEGHWV